MSELLQYIFNLEDPMGRTIVRWIFIVFGIGVINYVLHIGRIAFESFYLWRVKTYIKNNHGFGDISSDLLGKLPEAIGLKWSIIYRRIRDLVQIKQNGGQIDNDVLGDIHAGEASRKAGLSHYILGILIILGLIGTLWGLITAIIEVQPLLKDIDDLDQLPTISNALQETLKGMGTAFATTLAGLGTSLVLGLLGWLFNLANSAFLTKFETFASTEIIPHFTQAPESAIESSMVHLNKSVGEFKIATEDNVRQVQEAIQQLSAKSWDAFLEQQYVIANELRQIPGEFRESLGEINEYQDLIKSTVESFEKMTEKFMTEISEHQSTVVDPMVNEFKELITQSMSQIKEYQETLRQGLENSVPKLEEESDALKTAIEEYQSSQSRFIDDLSDTLQTQLQSITENQKEMVLVLSQSVLEAQNTNFERIQTQLSNSRQEIVGVLTQLTDELQIRSVLERQNQIFERIETQLTENQKEMVLVLSQSVLEAQNTNFERIQTQLSGSQQEIVGVLTQLTDELQIRSVLEAQNQIFERIETQLTENQKEMVLVLSQSVLEAQNTNFERIQTQLSNSQQEIVGVLTQLTDELQIRSVLEAQNQIFERIETQLIGSQSAMLHAFTQLTGELQIRSTLEAQNQIFERIEGHLIEHRELVSEQREQMQTLSANLQHPPQTTSIPTPPTSGGGSSHEISSQSLDQISSNLDLLNQKMDTLNNTTSQPGLYRWGSAIRRWFGIFRK